MSASFEAWQITPVVGFAVLAIFLLVYRKPVSDFLSRLKEFNFHRGEITVEAKAYPVSAEGAQAPGQKDRPDDVDPERKNAAALVKATDSSHEEGDSDETSPAALRTQIFAAFQAKEVEKAERLIEQLRRAETDSEELVLDRARWYGARYLVGLEGQDALEKIEEISREPRVRGRTLYFLGTCYGHGGQFRQAAKAFLDSADAFEDLTGRREALVEASQSLAKAGSADEAEATIRKELQSAPDEKGTGGLWIQLAALYLQEGDAEKHALALHKAAEIDANEPKARFNAAYALGEIDPALAPLVAYLYERSLNFDSEDPTALNNYGVQWQRLGLPLLAVDFYKLSAEKGETLAVANLAGRLIDAGFGEEAKKELDKANQTANAHENVASAMARLAASRSAEAQKQSEALRDGERMAVFMGDFVSAWLRESNSNLSGTWIPDPGDVPMTVKQRDSKIEAEWLKDDGRYGFAGELEGSASKVVLRAMNYVGSGDARRESRWEEKGSGYLIIGSDQELSLMALTGGTLVFTRLTREAVPQVSA